MSTGWMLGSLDLIGNWTGLLKSLAVGIGDFVHLRSSHSTSDRQALTSTDYHHRGTSTIIPVQTGIDRTVSIVSGDQTSSASHPISAATQSPYKSVLILNALYGFSGGLRSLVDRTTDGFIRSVTGMALSLARNLDHLSLDDRHRLRQDASRRANQPQSIGQGVNRGLASFSLCLLGALAGLANQPLEPLFASMADDTATPSRWTSVGAGMLKGAGRGILGAIVKPASGAADLVAQTGLGWVNKRRRSIDTLVGNHTMLDTVTRSFGPLDAIDKQLLLTITSKCIDMTLRRSLAIAGADWIVLGLLRESDSSIRPVLVHLCPDSNNMTLSVIDISTVAVNCTQTSLTPIELTCTSTASLKFRRSVDPETTLELELGSFDGALVKEFISINDSVKIDLLLPSDAATVSSQLPSKDHVTSERLLSTTSTWSRVKAYLKSSTTNNQTLDV